MRALNPWVRLLLHSTYTINIRKKIHIAKYIPNNFEKSEREVEDTTMFSSPSKAIVLRYKV